MKVHWYRGHQSGIFDAYKTLKDRFPEAGRYLLQVYRMDAETGDIEL
jgi:hypothetical protein